MKLTRREWHKLTLGGLVSAAFVPTTPRGAAGKSKAINSRFRGVQIGAQTYSFRDRSLDDMLKGMVEARIGSCELWTGHLEPTGLERRSWEAKSEAERNRAREELRRYFAKLSTNDIKAVRAKFDRAGVDIYALNYSMRDDFTDAEMERGFEMARILGAKVMTSSSNVSTVKRIDGFARKYRMRVGMHNHSNNDDPNEFATPDSFVRAMQGTSPYIAINLDIGHFTAANWDAVDFIRRHHDRIVALHIKDRKRNQGENMPFGQGDTPIKEALTLLRDNKWPIPANIEYEYEGSDTIAEMKRCLAYCKGALES